MNRLKTQVSVDQGVLRVTLNDPDRLNPMSAEAASSAVSFFKGS